jgi:GTP-binding protein
MKIISAEFVGGAMNLTQVPQDGRPHLAFAGRSNVGKSSLLNALTNRKNLFRVSATPGKTQELNFYLINETFYFCDLPGIGYARFSKSKREELSELIGQYLETSHDLRGVVYLIDSRTGGTSLDIEAFRVLQEMKIPVLPVATKMDKLNQKEMTASRRAIMQNFQLDEPPLYVSSFKKLGLEHLSGAILEALISDPSEDEVEEPDELNESNESANATSDESRVVD